MFSLSIPEETSSVESSSRVLTLRAARLFFCVVGFALLMGVGLRAVGESQVSETRLSTVHATGDKAKLAESYGKVPLSFEPNRGQADGRVQFLSRGPGYGIFLTPSEAVLSFNKEKADGESVLEMKLVGANAAAAAEAEDKLPGTSNYMRGTDQTKWATGVPTYGKVKYAGVYPGVDLVFYGNQRQLEYDFVVAPGKDAGKIALEFKGAKPVVDANGDLVLGAGGEAKFKRPVVYQMRGGVRVPVDGAYEVAGQRVRFRLGKYDHSRELVIDPMVTYLTYLGGSLSNNIAAIAIDSAGAMYITGSTQSTDFPLKNPYESSFPPGQTSMFVTKLNPTGTSLVYSTYLASNDDTAGSGIAVDGNGSAYVVGYSDKGGFPVTTGAFQTLCGAAHDTNGNRVDGCPGPEQGIYSGVLAKLSADGSSIVYATYLSGNKQNSINAVAVDAAGEAYVTGQTNAYCGPGPYSASTTEEFECFPTTNGSAQSATSIPSSGDYYYAFLTKFDAAGANPLYSSILGPDPDGAASSTNGAAIAVNANQVAFITGQTGNTLYTTDGSFQPNGAVGGNPAYVAAFDTNAAELLYSTYLGGQNAPQDAGSGIAADANDNAYITGTTSDCDFPTTTGAFETEAQYAPTDTANVGKCSAGFVAKLNPDGSALTWATYMNGTPLTTGTNTTMQALALGSDGSVYVAGSVMGTGYPMVNPVLSQSNTTDVPVVTHLSADGSTALFSSTLGGTVTTATEYADAIAVDSSGAIYVAGNTNEQHLPTTSGVVQPNFAGTPGQGANNGFLAKIGPSPAGSGSPVTPTITWAMPAAITTATPLSATQLDATAMDGDGNAVAGTFVYTPAAGTTLAVGTQTLSVTFTPNDTTDFTTATGTTTIVVTQGTSGGAGGAGAPTTTTALYVTSRDQSVTTVAAGSVVILSAQVLSGTNSVSPAQVAFCDATALSCTGSHLLAIAQVTEGGTANYSFVPGLGTHSYEAVFLGTSSYGASASAAASLTVTGTFATATTIAQSGSAGNFSLAATTVGSNPYPAQTSTQTVTINLGQSSQNYVLTGTGATTVNGSTYGNFYNSQGSCVPSGSITTCDLTGSFTSSTSTYAAGTYDLQTVFSSSISSAILSQTQNPVGTEPNYFDYSAFASSLNMTLKLNVTGGGSFVIPLGAGGNYAPSLDDIGFAYTSSVCGGTSLGSNPCQLDYVGTVPGATISGPVTGSIQFEMPATPPSVGPTGMVSFLDTSNANAVLGTSALGAAVPGFALAQAGGSPVAVGSGPYGMATGDFNGDGLVDLVVQNYYSGTVSVLLGKGDGTFQAQVTYPVGTLPERVLVADMNGDGILDLIVANTGSGTISILLGNGDGTFQAQVTYPCASPVGLGVMDINHDGIPDVVAGDYYSNTISVLLGRGNGTLNAAVTYATGGTPQTLAEGDFNGDGNIDVVVGNESGATVGIFLGNGDGTFRTMVTYPVGNLPQGVQVGDFNGDGKQDLAVSNQGDGTVSVLLGNGDGTFQPQVTYPVGVQPVGIAIADLNGDGIPDITVGNTGQASLTQGVLLGKGDGTFQPQVTFPAGNFPYGVTTGDFNGDGIPDVVVANFNDGTATIFLSQATEIATATVTGIAPATGTHAVVASYPGDVHYGASVSQATNLVVGGSTTTVIAWTPVVATIPYGTALGAQQLNATATAGGVAVPGTFVYTPPAGTVLAAGTQTLSVVFTPTDAVDYTTATASVQIVVGGLFLTSFTPVGTVIGSADTSILLKGSGFVTNSVVEVNGAAIATTYVNPTTLAAVIPAALLAKTGTLAVMVVDPSLGTMTAAQTFTVLPPTGAATLTGPPTTNPGTQPSVTLSITNPYPVALTANFALTFASAGTTQVDDPSIQFSTGGRTYSYTVDANSTSVPPVELQAGTDAGTITITATLMADGVDVTPTGLAPLIIVVPPVIPVISGTTITASGTTLTVVVHGFSNTREVSSALFDFTAATGDSVGTPSVTIPAAGIFTTWFSDATSDAYGSTFTYTQIFNASADASTVGSVKVTLTNSVGTSVASTAQ